jgi:hypothetical protein
MLATASTWLAPCALAPRPMPGRRGRTSFGWPRHHRTFRRECLLPQAAAQPYTPARAAAADPKHTENAAGRGEEAKRALHGTASRHWRPSPARSREVSSLDHKPASSLALSDGLTWQLHFPAREIS